MPKIDLTPDEITQIATCVETELKSAKRAQNTSKTPQLKEVWLMHERALEQLKAKITSAK